MAVRFFIVGSKARNQDKAILPITEGRQGFSRRSYMIAGNSCQNIGAQPAQQP
jgi:hypothetical protein